MLNERFWSKVNIKGPNECWEWTACRKKPNKGHSKCRDDYGRFQLNGKARYSHILVWIENNGEIPQGMFICHHCDNPPCVNPKHLFLGTPKDNMQDMWQKGRKTKPTHCSRGHLFDNKNTYMTPDGHKSCRRCRADAAVRFRKKVAN